MPQNTITKYNINKEITQLQHIVSTHNIIQNNNTIYQHAHTPQYYTTDKNIIFLHTTQQYTTTQFIITQHTTTTL